MTISRGTVAALVLAAAAFFPSVPAHAQAYYYPVQQPVAEADPAYRQLLEDAQKVRSEGAAIGDASAAEVQRKVVAHVESTQGSQSELYLFELERLAMDLSASGGTGTTEARLLYAKILPLAARIHGEDSAEFRAAHLPYARVLALLGYDKEAADARLIAFEGQLEDVLGCGRVRDGFVSGCVQNEPIFASHVTLVANALASSGQESRIEPFFARVMALFEEKWSQCDGPGWDFDCSEVPGYREEILGAQAQYYDNAGDAERVLDIYRRIFESRLARFEPCLREDRGYCSNFALRSAWRDYDRALEEAGELPARIAALEQAVDATARESGWMRRDTQDLTSEEEDEVEAIGEMLESYAALASANGVGEGNRAFLAKYGSGAILDTHLGGEELERRIAALTERRDLVADESEEFFDLGEQILDLVTQLHGPGSNEQLSAYRDLYWPLDRAGQADRSIELRRASLAAQRAAHSDDFHAVLTVLDDLTDALVEQGRRDEAVAVLKDVLLSPDNDKLAVLADRMAYGRVSWASFSDPFDAYGNLNARLAKLALERGDPAAIDAARASAAAKRAYRRSLGFDPEAQDRYEQAMLGGGFFDNGPPVHEKFSHLADALWAAHGEGAPMVVQDEAYAALQDAMVSTVTLAVGRTAGEQLVERAGLTDLLARRDALTSAAAMGDSFEGRPIGDQLSVIELTLREAAPEYFALVRPEPVSIAKTQALLAPSEAIVVLVPTAFGTHAMAITKDRTAWHRSPLDRSEIETYVRALRADLDPAGSEVPQPWTYIFDRQSAYELYRELVAPLEAQLDGVEEIFFAPSGPLAALPMSVLVTTPPQGMDDDLAALRATDWLIDRYALVQLPSVQSLALLRAGGTGAATGDPASFMGFGDPVLDGEGSSRGREADTRFATDRNVLRGSLASVAAIRELARLPGTAVELEAIRAVLDAPTGALKLAGDARESVVKRSDLSDMAILAFATHGLLAGEIDSALEPGLVLTPPDEASEIDDGLLTASEIATLDLAAEWVILSACNTAVGEGIGGEGLSGLARSFFFAGARSVLASHWPVRDDLAAVLSSRSVALRREDPSLSRGKALRRAMIAVRDDPTDETAAHPSSWAPFVVIGDSR